MLQGSESRRQMAQDGSLEETMSAFIPVQRDAEGQPVWNDQPSVENQHQHPGMFKLMPATVRVLDSGNPEDMTLYGEILTGSMPQAGTLTYMVHEGERRFSVTSAGWKNFILWKWWFGS